MSVELTRLANGLTVVTDAMPEVESASVGVYVDSGARCETETTHGISHLLEHMAFKGTRRRSARAIAEAIEDVGGDLNASTSVETTAFYARVLGPDVPLAIDILADILTDPVFDADELAREKNVVLQELGAADDVPEDKVFDLFPEAAWRAQPIGRPILGTPESLATISPESLRAHLGGQYRAGSMILSAAGAVDHDAVVRQAESAFASLPAGATPAPTPARYTGGERREERPVNEVQLVLGFEAPSLTAPDYFVAQCLSMVIGGGMSSRLFQTVREDRGLCYAISSFHWAFHDTGLLGIHAATEEQDAAELVEVTLGELVAAAEAIDEAEVRRAAAQMKAGLLMARESSAARIGQMARSLIYRGRVIGPDELVAMIEAVDAAAVRGMLAGMLGRADVTLATVGRTGRVPKAGAVARRLEDGGMRRVA